MIRRKGLRWSGEVELGRLLKVEFLSLLKVAGMFVEFKVFTLEVFFVAKSFFFAKVISRKKLSVNL